MSYCANLVQYPPLAFFTACSATQHSCLLPPCQTINKKLPTNIFDVCVIDMRQASWNLHFSNCGFFHSWCQRAGMMT